MISSERGCCCCTRANLLFPSPLFPSAVTESALSCTSFFVCLALPAFVYYGLSGGEGGHRAGDDKSRRRSREVGGDHVREDAQRGEVFVSGGAVRWADCLDVRRGFCFCVVVAHVDAACLLVKGAAAAAAATAADVAERLGAGGGIHPVSVFFVEASLLLLRGPKPGKASKYTTS